MIFFNTSRRLVLKTVLNIYNDTTLTDYVILVTGNDTVIWKRWQKKLDFQIYLFSLTSQDV